MGKGSSKKPKAKIKSSAPRTTRAHPPKRRARRAPLIITGLVALIVGVGVGVAAAPDDGGDAEIFFGAKDIKVISKIKDSVDNHLSTIGATLPGGTYTAFPQLQLSLDGFEKGDVEAKTLQADAEAAASGAKAKAAALAALDLSIVAPDLPEKVSSDMFGAQQDMVKALSIYQVSASLMAEAMSSRGAQQGFLLEKARALKGVGDALMADGYEAYSRIVGSAGLSSPAPPSGGVPPFGAQGDEAPVPPEGG